MSGRRARTEFELYGLAAPAAIVGRHWLFTVDFEAFDGVAIDRWTDAMERWGDRLGRGGWKSCIFLAIEDVVRLRHEDPRAYSSFLGAASRMAEAGATFYPHNHGVFDEDSGRQFEDRPEHIEGYRKRASFFYDVVRRHGADLEEWLNRVVHHWQVFLDDAGLSRPTAPAFRAGGWDHGATRADAETFVRGVEAAGFTWDSSASTGAFGTRGWRIGAPYGRNVYRLGPRLVEAASCWSVDDVRTLVDPRTARSGVKLVQPPLWRRSPGLFVTVFHFHNLVIAPSAERGNELSRRLDRLFAKLDLVRRALELPSATFDDVVLVDG